MIKILQLILINLIFLNTSFASKVDCNKAPPDDRKICLSMAKAREYNKEDEKAKETAKISGSKFRTKMRISVKRRYELECLTLNCYCSYLGGISNGSINDCTLSNGQKLKKAIRKELRMLTDEERNEIFAAFNEMKKRGDYDYMARIHRDAFEAGKWHSGPAFNLVHKEMLKRVEIMLRKSNQNASLSYWDPTLESPLQVPADSILFTELFLGSTDANGYVVTGAFKDWKTLEGNPHITRNLGQEGRCLHENDIQWILSQTKIEDVLAYIFPDKGCPFDYLHGKVHSFISGDMLSVDTSCNDVAFMFFHCFMANIFELWRQKQQTREERATIYPKDIAACAPPSHFRDAEMYLFEVINLLIIFPQFLKPLKNCDGLRNEYTDNMYEYAPRPTCTATTDCGSKYLFCDRLPTTPRCVAKVRLGGNCKGFNKDADICYEGICVDNVCIEQKITTTTTASTIITSTQLTSTIINKYLNKQITTSKHILNPPREFLQTLKTIKNFTTFPVQNINKQNIKQTNNPNITLTNKEKLNKTTCLPKITKTLELTTIKTKECKNPSKTIAVAEFRKKIYNFLKRIINQPPEDNC